MSESIERLAWTWVAAIAVAIVCILLQGCTIETPRSLLGQNISVSDYRELYPDTPEGCLVVWIRSGERRWIQEEKRRGDVHAALKFLYPREVLELSRSNLRWLLDS